MDYLYFKKKYPNDILVYIEEYNKAQNFIIFDFLDEEEFNSFLGNDSDNTINRASFVCLQNYKNRRIQVGTIYSINIKTINEWKNKNLISTVDNSMILGYNINLIDLQNEVFYKTISIKSTGNYFHTYYGTKVESLISTLKGSLNVVIRNVGQANWNEIRVLDEVKLVFDIGAPKNASTTDVKKIIGKKESEYEISKPLLILSHWDVDHYHCLKVISDDGLKNFSYFICRDLIIGRTAIEVFRKVVSSIGHERIITFPAEPKISNKGIGKFINKTPTNNQVVLYNAQEHKDKNVSGILITVKTSKSSIVLSGDCHYKQISKDVLPHLNYQHHHHLVVPHHGGLAGKFVYELPNKVVPGKAIISVGEKQFGVPENIVGLKSLPFEIIFTRKEKKDITIKL